MKDVCWNCGGGLPDVPFMVVSEGLWKGSEMDRTRQVATHSMTMLPEDCPCDCRCEDVVVAPFREE